MKASASVDRSLDVVVSLEPLVLTVVVSPHVKPSSIGVSIMSNIDGKTLVREG